MNKNRHLIVPNKLDEDNINYTAKSQTFECFVKSITINKMIEKTGYKPYNMLPNSTSLIPNNILITGSSLIYVFQNDERRSELITQTYNEFIIENFKTKQNMVYQIKQYICNQLLNTDTRQTMITNTNKMYSINICRILNSFMKDRDHIKQYNVKTITNTLKKYTDIDKVTESLNKFEPTISLISLYYTVFGKHLFRLVFNMDKLKSGDKEFNETIFMDGKNQSSIFIKGTLVLDKFDPQIKEIYPNIENLSDTEKKELLDVDQYVLIGQDPGKNDPIHLCGMKLINDEKLIEAESELHNTQTCIIKAEDRIRRYDEMIKSATDDKRSIDKINELKHDRDMVINGIKNLRLFEKDQQSEYDALKKEYSEKLEDTRKVIEKQISDDELDLEKNIKVINTTKNREQIHTLRSVIKDIKIKITQNKERLNKIIKKRDGYLRNGDIKYETYNLSSGRWRQETGMTRASKKRNDLTNKDQKIKKILNELSKKTHRTMNYYKYIQYWKLYMKHFKALQEFYKQPIFRKLKFETYIGKQRMEAKIVKEIKDIYLSGDNANKKLAIFYGMWGGSNHLKGFYSTPNKWMKKMLAKYFIILDIDEYNTSKRYHKTGLEIKKWKDSQGKEVHSVLLTKYTNSKEEVIDIFINRDDNGSINIYECGNSILKGLGRPEHLRRPTKTVEEDG